MAAITGNEFNESFMKWGNTNPQFNITPASISGGGLSPQANYGYSSNYGTPGSVVPSTAAGGMGPNFNWGTLGNTFGAIQGGIGIYNNIMDILGKSDADKARKFAKTFTMREWNTKARQYDNQLQMARNKTNMWNASHPNQQISTEDGLKTLGTWGSAPGRVLDAGTQAQYSGNNQNNTRTTHYAADQVVPGGNNNQQTRPPRG